MNYWRALTLEEVRECEMYAEAVCFDCREFVPSVYTLLAAQLRITNEFPSVEDAAKYLAEVRKLKPSGLVRDQVAVKDRSRLGGAGILIGTYTGRSWQEETEVAG